MTFLDRVLISRAQEQVAKALEVPERFCEWLEQPRCGIEVAFWSKSGLCTKHGLIYRTERLKALGIKRIWKKRRAA